SDGTTARTSSDGAAGTRILLCASSTNRSMSATITQIPLDRCGLFHRRMTPFGVADKRRTRLVLGSRMNAGHALLGFLRDLMQELRSIGHRVRNEVSVKGSQ